MANKNTRARRAQARKDGTYYHGQCCPNSRAPGRNPWKGCGKLVQKPGRRPTTGLSATGRTRR